MTTRRDFLKQMRAASLAAMAASLPTASFLSGCRRRIPATALLGDRPTDDAVQDVLWAVFMLPDFQLIY